MDGNEYLILKGAKKTLDSKYLKTILVELDINHPYYRKSIDLITSKGLILTDKFNQSNNKKNSLMTTLNHIFIKK